MADEFHEVALFGAGSGSQARFLGASLLGFRSNEKQRTRNKGEEDLGLRTDLPGIDETAQPFSATAGPPFSTLVLRREPCLGGDIATGRRYEYPVFLRSDQPLRGVTDGIDAFFPDVGLTTGHGRAALHVDGDYLLIVLLSHWSQWTNVHR